MLAIILSIYFSFAYSSIGGYAGNGFNFGTHAKEIALSGSNLCDKTLGFNQFSNPALLYAYTGCTSLIFMLPVIIPFYNHQLGLTFQDFLFAEAFFACVVIAMEVPIGYMSDRWSRKFTLSVASLFGMIGYTAIIIADGLVGVMIAQGILGVAVACNSGTISALMYDSLLENGNLKTYQNPYLYS